MITLFLLLWDEGIPNQKLESKVKKLFFAMVFRTGFSIFFVVKKILSRCFEQIANIYLVLREEIKPILDEILVSINIPQNFRLNSYIYLLLWFHFKKKPHHYRFELSILAISKKNSIAK